MTTAYRPSKSYHTAQVLELLFFALATIGLYVFLEEIALIFLTLLFLWIFITFWHRNRILIILHKDHLEAKEAILVKNKLIRYSDITEVTLHKNGRKLILRIDIHGMIEKVKISLTPLEQKHRIDLINNIKSNIRLKNNGF